MSFYKLVKRRSFSLLYHCTTVGPELGGGFYRLLAEETFALIKMVSLIPSYLSALCRKYKYCWCDVFEDFLGVPIQFVLCMLYACMCCSNQCRSASTFLSPQMKDRVWGLRLFVFRDCWYYCYYVLFTEPENKNIWRVIYKSLTRAMLLAWLTFE